MAAATASSGRADSVVAVAGSVAVAVADGAVDGEDNNNKLLFGSMN